MYEESCIMGKLQHKQINYFYDKQETASLVQIELKIKYSTFYYHQV